MAWGSAVPSALLGISEFAFFFLITPLHIDFCTFVGSCFTFMGSCIITFKFLFLKESKPRNLVQFLANVRGCVVGKCSSFISAAVIKRSNQKQCRRGKWVSSSSLSPSLQEARAGAQKGIWRQTCLLKHTVLASELTSNLRKHSKP